MRRVCAATLFFVNITDMLSSVQRGGRVEIIANDQGHRITPSWVSFSDDERLVGDSAKNAYQSNPENTVFDAKRLIGRKIDDPEIKRDQKHWYVFLVSFVSALV